jgi:hypothetical protein
VAVLVSPETRAEVPHQAQADGEEAPKHYNQAEKAKGGVGPLHREPGQDGAQSEPSYAAPHRRS